MMIANNDIKNLMLYMDLNHASLRRWQLFSANSRVLQTNGSNPRIRELKFQEENLEIFADKVEIFECRIVKDVNLESLIRVDRSWYISFDAGVTRTKFQVVAIKEHTIQDVAWIVLLGR